ncbi:hypothetical protein [Embleya hyalina]|uniref:Uncharacterized protein n=1 Tax=Embleya hyalina TaxID=516124 RepID=A0A401YE44_9ACTN|nr:hypothetical protein [Embleya hyalina]GCD92884.1 hypothetical protein EHYA_00527 [Embleya hyalina]
MTDVVTPRITSVLYAEHGFAWGDEIVFRGRDLLQVTQAVFFRLDGDRVGEMIGRAPAEPFGKDSEARSRRPWDNLAPQTVAVCVETEFGVRSNSMNIAFVPT